MGQKRRGGRGRKTSGRWSILIFFLLGGGGVVLTSGLGSLKSDSVYSK